MRFFYRCRDCNKKQRIDLKEVDGELVIRAESSDLGLVEKIRELFF